MFAPRFSISKKTVGLGRPCFIVAEMSANHRQNYQKAVAIIKAAARAGADAIKVQTYTPDTLTINSNRRWFRVKNPTSPKLWHQQTLYELYQKGYLLWEWHKKLKKVAESSGLIFFSTAYDPTSVDFLETLDVPAYKIASYEATDLELLKKVARTKKPVILSVGFATTSEIALAVKTLRNNGCGKLILLYCVTSYTKQASPRVNLATMIDLRQRFKTLSGFSDNSGGTEAPVLAAAMGAVLVEKHFIDRHDPKALDDQFSLDEREFRQMVDEIREQETTKPIRLTSLAQGQQGAMIGRVAYGPQGAAEKRNLQFRRSLFVVKDVKRGERFNKANVRSIRPSYGLEPRVLEKVMGKKSTRTIKAGTPLMWKLIAS